MTLRLCTLQQPIPLTALRLASDGIATLKPAGMHLMLMNPSATLKDGSKVVVDFKLAGGGQRLDVFEARKSEP